MTNSKDSIPTETITTDSGKVLKLEEGYTLPFYEVALESDDKYYLNVTHVPDHIEVKRVWVLVEVEG